MDAAKAAIAHHQHLITGTCDVGDSSHQAL
jgi:hypothetical protein